MSTEWIAAVETAAAQVVGEERVGQARRDWRAHAREGIPLAVVHGAVKSGKTTLVKRLLVEDDAPVPDWLVVAGHRETIQVRQASASRLAYLDTPGTDSGNPEHDQLAGEAAALADVVVIVVMPRWLASDVALVRSFTTGSFFADTLGDSPAALFPARSLLVVIAKADLLGIDYDDNPGGFRALSASSRAELMTALAPQPGESPLRVHVVCADVGARVGGAANPTRSDYLPADDWDGLAGLRADLAAAHQQLGVLREAALIRYTCVLGQRAVTEATETIGRLRSALADAESDHGHRAALSRRLDELDTAAAANLRAVLGEQLGRLANSAGSDLGALRDEADGWLQESVGSWYQHWNARLVSFVAEIEQAATIKAEQLMPPSLAFDSWLASLARLPDGSPGGADGGGKIFEAVSRLPIRDIDEGLFRQRTGLSPEEARGELKRVLEAGKFKDYRGSPGALFAKKWQAAAVREQLSSFDQRQFLAPLLVELAPALVEEISQQLTTLRRRRTQEHVRQQIREISEVLEAQILGDRDSDRGWAAAVRQVRSLLAADLETDAAASQRQIEELTAARSALRQLLQKPPQPAGLPSA